MENPSTTAFPPMPEVTSDFCSQAATAAVNDDQLPPPIETRAMVFAMHIVEGHYESATGGHLHWMYRELSKLMHRDFALSAREEALTRSSSQRRKSVHARKTPPNL